MSVELARSMLARGSKSFALAARVLPPSCRDDVAVLYAYCRRADDRIDDATASEQPARIEAPGPRGCFDRGGGEHADRLAGLRFAALEPHAQLFGRLLLFGARIAHGATLL